MNGAFSWVLPLVSDFSNVNNCMAVTADEWVWGTSVFRTSLEVAEPTEDNWGSSCGKNNTKVLNKGKCRNSQHSKLTDTLMHKYYEWLTASFKFLLQISGSQAWLHVEITWGSLKYLIPGSSPRDSDLNALSCRLGTGLHLCNQDW